MVEIRQASRQIDGRYPISAGIAQLNKGPSASMRRWLRMVTGSVRGWRHRRSAALMIFPVLLLALARGSVADIGMDARVRQHRNGRSGSGDRGESRRSRRGRLRCGPHAVFQLRLRRRIDRAADHFGHAVQPGVGAQTVRGNPGRAGHASRRTPPGRSREQICPRIARRLHQRRDDRRTGDAYVRTAAADRSPAMAERFVYAAAILRHAQRMDAAIRRAAGEAAHLYACGVCAAAARARTSLRPSRSAS